MKKNAVAFLLLLSFPPLWFPILFDKIHSVYESHVQSTGRRGPYLHTGYILFQLLRLLGKEAKAEEFNTLASPVLRPTEEGGLHGKPSSWLSPTTVSGPRCAVHWDGSICPRSSYNLWTVTGLISAGGVK